MKVGRSIAFVVSLSFMACNTTASEPGSSTKSLVPNRAGPLVIDCQLKKLLSDYFEESLSFNEYPSVSFSMKNDGQKSVEIGASVYKHELDNVTISTPPVIDSLKIVNIYRQSDGKSYEKISLWSENGFGDLWVESFDEDVDNAPKTQKVAELKCQR